MGCKTGQHRRGATSGVRWGRVGEANCSGFLPAPRKCLDFEKATSIWGSMNKRRISVVA